MTSAALTATRPASSLPTVGEDLTAAQRHELIQGHMAQVSYAVNALSARLPRHVGRDDLISAGMLGLTQAAANYDPTSGVPFDRFAKLRIQGALLDELRSRDWASRSVRRNARRMQEARDSLIGREGRAPTTAETAAEMGVSVEEVQRIVDDVHRGTVLNYESLITDGPADDLLPSSGASPEQLCVARERRAVLLDAIAALPDRLRTVVVEYFFNEQPMATIAETLGVTESRISQMRGEAFSLIRQAMSMTLDGADVPQEDLSRGRTARRRAAYYLQVAGASTVGQRLDAVPMDRIPLAA